MAQHCETRGWSVRHAQNRGTAVTMAIVKCQRFFHGIAVDPICPRRAFLACLARHAPRLFWRANPQSPGEFGSKDGQAAKEQAGGDPSRDLNSERIERNVPGHRSEYTETHRPQAQSSQLNGSPSVHDGCELISIGPLFFLARDSAGRQYLRDAIG